MATIVDGKKRIPFLRGMLAHYLIDHGLSFRDAYEVADRLRSDIQKKKEVQAKTMVELVHTHVKGLFGDRPIGDGVFWEPRPRQILVEGEHGRRPFSREHLSNSLVISGLEEDQAYRIALQIAMGFASAGKTVVTRDDIRQASIDILRDEWGRAFAERYEIWHQFRNRRQSRPLIILIGGASGVGKTSAGVALANLLGISRVASTDEIRQVMRLMIAPDLMPALHVSTYEAWKVVTAPLTNKADTMIQAFREQAMRVCVGVKATIQRAIEENVSLVLDGIHLLPDLLDLETYGDEALFIWTNLYLSDERAYSERFQTRSQEASQRPQHRYIEYLNNILKIQKHIMEVGEAYQLPAVENVDLDETVQSISLHIMDTLRKEAKAGQEKEKPKPPKKAKK